MIQITIITLICCLLFGVPIAFAIGIAGTAGLYFGSTAPMFMVVKQFFEGINSFSYMAIPLFILAGAIMGKGGISKRIVNFASAILSWLRGGTAITTVGASMIFAAVSGSGAATISAIGGITVPEMLKKGYSRGFTAAMSAGAGSLGPIIPPSVDMIVFGCITGFSSIFSYIFALEGMGQKIVDFMLSITTSPTGLFFLVIAFMVVIGCFMESLAALPIILPIIYPMFASLGVNLNQLGVVFALSTVLGGLTPPVGIYLFLSMNLTGSKMRDTVLPHMLIVIGIMLLVIVLCILLPIPQFLPDLVFGAAT